MEAKLSRFKECDLEAIQGSRLIPSEANIQMSESTVVF